MSPILFLILSYKLEAMILTTMRLIRNGAAKKKSCASTVSHKASRRKVTEIAPMASVVGITGILRESPANQNTASGSYGAFKGTASGGYGIFNGKGAKK